MDEAKRLYTLNKLIQMYLPVRNGLKLALEILGPAMSTESREAAKKYQKQIEERLDLVLSNAKTALAEGGSKVSMDGRGFKEWELREQ